MASPLNVDSKIVLKLDLGKNGVRRINITSILRPSCQRSKSIVVSYDRLVETAVKSSNIELEALRNKSIAVCITYMDEDGDEITISSDEELTEALTQFLHLNPPILRAKAVITKEDVNAVEQCNVKHKGHGRTNSPMTLDQVDPPTVHSNTIKVKDEAEETAGYDRNLIHGRHTCDEPHDFIKSWPEPVKEEDEILAILSARRSRVVSPTRQQSQEMRSDEDIHLNEAIHRSLLESWPDHGNDEGEVFERLKLKKISQTVSGPAIEYPYQEGENMSEKEDCTLVGGWPDGQREEFWDEGVATEASVALMTEETSL